MNGDELKILFVAFGCEPGRGSEPGVGWGFVEEASRRRPVWVLTHAHQKEALDSYLATKHKYHPIHPIYVRIPGFFWLWKSHFGMNLYYYLWQLKAGFLARRLQEQMKFDVVHHVSFTRYWMHSAGAIVGAPFVFGPVGGGDHYPEAFMGDLRPHERFREFYWKLVRRVMEFDPLFRRTLRKAKVTIGSGHYAAEQFQRLGLDDVPVMSAVAPTPQLPPPGPGPGPNDVFRFVSIGRVPRWKGVQFGIEAFAQAFGPKSPAGHCNAEYVVIGDGSYLPQLRKLADQLGVADRVKFEGDLPYTKCLEALTTAGAVVHPALRDSAGLVFEALSLGVPVACCDIGTPALLVDESCGAVVPTAGGHDDVVKRLAESMLRWRQDGAHYQALRHGAVERSKAMSRSARGDRMDEIYAKAIAMSGDVTEGMPPSTPHNPPAIGSLRAVGRGELKDASRRRLTPAGGPRL